MDRLVSLAAGTVPELDPPDTVAVAAAAGYGGAGVWYDDESWSPARTRDTKQRFADTGLVPLDMEPVMLTDDGDWGDRLVDVAAELGVRNVLVAGRTRDHAAATERFGQLCDRAAPAGITMALEFLPIFGVRTLPEALAIVTAAGRPNGGILVDALHLARSGGHPDDLAAVPPALLPYLQLADAPTDAPDDLYDEAVHGRLLLGDGALPLAALLAAVPAVPVSLELRSRALRDAYEPQRRAEVVLASVAGLP